MFYPRDRNSSSNEQVKQAVRRNERRGRKESGEPSGAGPNCPPGSRDRSNISCSSVWPTTAWGVTDSQNNMRREKKRFECNDENIWSILYSNQIPIFHSNKFVNLTISWLYLKISICNFKVWHFGCNKNMTLFYGKYNKLWENLNLYSYLLMLIKKLT